MRPGFNAHVRTQLKHFISASSLIDDLPGRRRVANSRGGGSSYHLLGEEVIDGYWPGTQNVSGKYHAEGRIVLHVKSFS